MSMLSNLAVEYRTVYPPVGSLAPSFSAPDADGKIIALTHFQGKSRVVLYFYPEDNTPGCTLEACGFRDAHDTFISEGVAVIGVSPDSVASHRKFTHSNNLPFPLVADEDKQICRAYGVWQEKTLNGKKYMGVSRTTFIIDIHGKIAQVFKNVRPVGHEQEVLQWLRANPANPSSGQ